MKNKYDPETDMLRHSYCDEIKLELNKTLKKPTGEGIYKVYQMLVQLRLYDYIMKGKVDNDGD